MSEHEIDPSVRSGICEALEEGGLDAGEKAMLARAAMEVAGVPTSSAHRSLFLGGLAVIVAAALFAALAVLSRHGGNDGTAAGDPPLTEEEERRANEEFLASDPVQERLAEADDGAYVAIAGGRTLEIHREWRVVLERIEKAHPEAKHRFFFHVGEQGDVAYDFTVGDAPWAGSKFLKDARLSMGGGSEPGWWFHRRPSGKATFPSPDGRPRLPLTLGMPGEETRITFVVSSGSFCPLLLTGDGRFPLWEIPGRARLPPPGRAPLCRYLVRARNEALGLDTMVEALVLSGSLAPETKAPTLGGVAWLPYGDATLAVSKSLGRPVLLLVGHDLQVGLSALFSDAGDLKPLLEAFVPLYAEPEILKNVPEGVLPPRSGFTVASSLVVLYPEGDEPRVFKVGECLEIMDRTKPADLVAFLKRARKPERAPGSD